jgi:threonine/homoserine/homoserine lactone efflux protein
MTSSTLLPFSLFAFVTSITPGPNNLMLLASGVNFGFRPTIPHMLGISSGFLVMVIAVGLGLAEVFSQFPWIYNLLKWLGAIYMLYLAWRVATSGPPVSRDASPGKSPDKPAAKPLSFLGAAIFQWVNPKAWLMAVGAFSAYVPASGGLIVIIYVAILFAAIGFPVMGIWTLFGSKLRHMLQVRRTLIIFNYTMAALLVASLYPLLSAA